MKIFSFFYELTFILIGCLLAGFGVSNFLLPNQLSSGGFTGIATIFYYLFEIPMGIIMIIINIPIFVFGYFKTGKGFVIKTIFATILYSFFIDLFENILFIEDKFLSCIYGGFFIGIGLALVFKAKASTGGTDLIAYIAQNYNSKIKLSNMIVIIDIIVVILNVIVFGELEIGLYSAITIFIIGKMIDIVFEGIDFCKVIYIISEKHAEIMQEINEELQRGATALYGKGSFSNQNKMVIMCVSKRRDLEIIKQMSKRIDPKSFIVIMDAREVIGLGFKTWFFIGFKLICITN